MTSFDPFPEKLPSITMISQQRQSQQEQQGTDAMFSQDMAYSTFIPHHHTDMYTNVNISPNPTDSDIPLALYDQQTQQHLSSPLTPSLSPPGIMDPTQFKRKYSVDVGPFAFNAHPSLMHDQDAYRRSSCSAMSVDNWVQHQDSPHQQQHPYQIQQMNQHNDYQQPTYNNDCAYYDDQGLSPLTDDLDTITSIKHDPTMINNGNLTMAMTTTNYSNKAKKRRLGQHYQQGPNAPHKHVCKYSYCGWSFKRYEHLKRHMLVHTGERPHVCVFPGCGKSFSRSDNFHAHYRTHTKKQSPESHLGLQQHHLHHSQYIPTPTPRGARKENSSGAPETTMTDSPSSASSSSILSNQDLLHGVSSQPFVFNGNKPFDMSYPDVYDQRSFTSDMNDQYSSQSYLPLEMDSQAGLTSLMNHDQVSSSVFVTNDLASTYDLQGTYGDFHSNASMPPHSPTTPSTFTSAPTTKKQRKHRSTLLHCDTTDDGQQQHKSHVCPMTQCQRRFKRLEHLKRHMRIHTLERPFACTFPKCHKHFSRSDNLSQHMKTHQNRIGQDKRRSSTSSSSSPCTSSSSSSSPVSPRSVMDDFASPNLINQQYYPSSSAIDTCSEVISSFPSCWPTESIGC